MLVQKARSRAARVYGWMVLAVLAQLVSPLRADTIVSFSIRREVDPNTFGGVFNDATIYTGVFSIDDTLYAAGPTGGVFPAGTLVSYDFITQSGELNAAEYSSSNPSDSGSVVLVGTNPISTPFGNQYSLAVQIAAPTSAFTLGFIEPETAFVGGTIFSAAEDHVVAHMDVGQRTDGTESAIAVDPSLVVSVPEPSSLYLAAIAGCVTASLKRFRLFEHHEPKPVGPDSVDQS